MFYLGPDGGRRYLHRLDFSHFTNAILPSIFGFTLKSHHILCLNDTLITLHYPSSLFKSIYQPVIKHHVIISSLFKSPPPSSPGTRPDPITPHFLPSPTSHHSTTYPSQNADGNPRATTTTHKLHNRHIRPSPVRVHSTTSADLAALSWPATYETIAGATERWNQSRALDGKIRRGRKKLYE
jgi:hypothetical protein